MTEVDGREPVKPQTVPAQNLQAFDFQVSEWTRRLTSVMRSASAWARNHEAKAPVLRPTRLALTRILQRVSDLGSNSAIGTQPKQPTVYVS